MHIAVFFKISILCLLIMRMKLGSFITRRMIKGYILVYGCFSMPKQGLYTQRACII